MKKITITLFLIISVLSFSQEPFRFDTIRVSKDDARNIHQYQTNKNLSSQVRANSQLSQPSSESGFNPKNLRYGINFGLNLNSNYSLFRLAPQVGYQFNKYVMAGVGVSYYYSKNRLYHQQERVYHYNSSLGANAFAYLYPVSIIVLSAQPEVNYIWSKLKGDVSGNYYKENVIVPSFIIGAGLRLGPAHAMLYYDLAQDVNSPYSSGIFYGVSIYF